MIMTKRQFNLHPVSNGFEIHTLRTYALEQVTGTLVSICMLLAG